MIFNYIRLTKKNIIRYISSLIFFLSALLLNSQNISYNYFYRVYFNDKGADPLNFNSSDLLSARAVDRRERNDIITPDLKDIPVFSEYINQIRSLGLTLHCTSRWMNTGLFKSEEPFNTGTVLNLPFVKDVKIVKLPPGKSDYANKLDFESFQTDFPQYDQPIKMANGHILHNSGFDGRGILIAVLDGGFDNAEEIPSLKALYKRKGIKATRDFVSGNNFVYAYHTHGTAVLSVLAGNIEGILKGSAPAADFMLFRTENTNDEFPVEEDFWVAAAEFADSAGADIITSSLGYGPFDDPMPDYKFYELDGNSTFITRAADIAASKGILVFCSAGNERNKTWIRILAPSDGDSVICVGAVDGYGNISAFSSAGPSADGRIKPDNTTMGESVTVQVSPTVVSRSSGTSFSCPVLSGLSACLLQAVPYAKTHEIIDALHRSGNKFNAPDSLYGYGIPDMADALIRIQDAYLEIPEKNISVYPNPTNGEFEITFKEIPGSVKTEIFTSSGSVIFRKELDQLAGRRMKISALNNRPNGIYIIKLTTGTGVSLYKIIKIER